MPHLAWPRYCIRTLINPGDANGCNGLLQLERLQYINIMCRDANESVTQCKNTECDKKFRLLAVRFWKVERAREIAEGNWSGEKKREETPERDCWQSTKSYVLKEYPRFRCKDWNRHSVYVRVWLARYRRAGFVREIPRHLYGASRVSRRVKRFALPNFAFRTPDWACSL